MKKILITGASGFLGRRAVAAFGQDYVVYTPSHTELDITSTASVESTLTALAPELVLHCAAISDVGRCQQEPELSRQINVEGSLRIVQASRAVGAKCVLCSSDQVYFGSTVQQPHREDEALNPTNVYGCHKLEAEQRCLCADPDCVLLRLSWMYDRASQSLTEHGDFLRTLLDQLCKGTSLVYPIHDRRGITDVNQVVQRLRLAFTLPGGVYNFGSPNTMSTFALMQRVLFQLGVERPLTENTQAFCSAPRNLCMDPGKAAAYGVVFSTTEEGLVENLKALL